MADRLLRVAIVAPAFVYMPLWAAKSKGFFAEEGLDVDIAIAGGSTHGVTERLLDGRADIGLGTPEGVLLEPNSRLTIVAGHANRAALSLVAQPGFHAIEALRGARFGVASLTEGTAYILRDILGRHGLREGDYTMSLIGTHPVRWEALQAGTLDAALQLVPYNFMAADAGFSILAQAYDYVPDYAFTTINVRNAWAQANAGTLEAFLRATVRATRWMYGHHDATVEIAAAASGVPEAYVERAVRELVEHEVVSSDLALNLKGLAMVEKTLADAGADVPVKPEGVVDLRWLHAAIESLDGARSLG